MANFSGLILTDIGRNILAEALTGEEITFTRVALGDGDVPQNPEALVALVSEKRNAPIQSFSVVGDGTSRIRAIVTNAGLAAGFFAREVGIFATNPATGTETLYAYANAGNQADYLPAAGGATIVEQLFDLFTVVDSATNVTAIIDSSIIYATKDELTGVALEGDKLIFPGSTTNYLITNFSSFATYAASTSVGTVTVTDDTVSLTLDGGTPSGGLDLTVSRNGTPYIFRIAIGEQTVAAPTIENPANGATDVGSGVTLTTSEFLTYPEGADTHASTDWQVATDAGFTNIVFESLDDAANLEAIAVPSGTFDESTTYYARARHTGTTLGDGAYSATVTFTTKAAFYPTAEVGKLVPFTVPGSFDAYGRDVALSGSYAAVSGTNMNYVPIYERNSSGDWVNVDTVFFADPFGNGAEKPSVDIDGGRLIVGWRLADNGGTARGAAYIYDRDGGGNWVLQATLGASDATDNYDFGYAVAVSGDYALVSNLTSGTSDTGGVYVFERNGSGTWVQVQKLEVSGDYDGYGAALDISGDYAVVGVPDDNTNGANSGSIFVYERDGAGVWQEIDWFPGAGTNFRLGYSVSIDGGRIAAGAIQTTTASNPGFVAIYERNPLGGWAQTDSLAASDGLNNDYLGLSVSLSGDYLAASSDGDVGGLTSVGAVYVFGRDGAGDWSQIAKLTSSDFAANDEFGLSVALDGNYLIAGAPSADDFASGSGAVYVFE